MTKSSSYLFERRLQSGHWKQYLHTVCGIVEYERTHGKTFESASGDSDCLVRIPSINFDLFPTCLNMTFWNFCLCSRI